MKHVTLPLKELEVIAATRLLLGIGAAFLLGHLLSDRQRRRAGWALVAIGAISTPPLIFDVYMNRTED